MLKFKKLFKHVLAVNWKHPNRCIVF